MEGPVNAEVNYHFLRGYIPKPYKVLTSAPVTADAALFGDVATAEKAAAGDETAATKVVAKRKKRQLSASRKPDTASTADLFKAATTKAAVQRKGKAHKSKKRRLLQKEKELSGSKPRDPTVQGAVPVVLAEVGAASISKAISGMLSLGRRNL